MEAGRPLDALVAEKVMGWTLKGPDHGIAPDDEEVALKYGPDASWEVPRFSTEVSDAWPIMDVVAERTSLRPSLYRRWNGDWVCVFATEFDHGFDRERAAKEPAHAICLAALAALKIELPAGSPAGQENR